MRSRRGETGAAALEFAFLLPLLLLLIYGMVVYSYLFVVQEAITFAAQEAAESAVKVDPTADDYEDLVEAEVRATAARVLDFLPASQRARVVVNDPVIGPSPTGIGGIVTVNLRFNFIGLFPQIPLPGLGAIPPMPGTLVATAVVGV